MATIDMLRSFLTIPVLLVMFSIVRCDEMIISDGDRTLCTMIESRHIATYPWTEYPLVYEPIVRGRLTVWAGSSTAPTCKLNCVQNASSFDHIQLELVNFADRYEWTFYDTLKGITLYGITVHHREDVKTHITIENKQAMSYKECREIRSIDFNSIDDKKASFTTVCDNCNSDEVYLIEGQLREMVKIKFNNQLIDNLYWHLAPLISSQHFSGYLVLDDNLD